MRGNRNFIYSKVVENEECPIKDENIVKIILNEYDDEFNRLLQYCETPVIYRRGLGVWFAKNTKLRSHIRYLITTIRNSRLANNEKYKIKEDTMVNRLRICLLQLDDIRKVFIARKNRWEAKKYNKSIIDQ